MAANTDIFYIITISKLLVQPLALSYPQDTQANDDPLTAFHEERRSVVPLSPSNFN